MTNQTLRERFRLPENKSAIVSQVIAATIDSDLVKADGTVGRIKEVCSIFTILGMTLILFRRGAEKPDTT